MAGNFRELRTRFFDLLVLTVLSAMVIFPALGQNRQWASFVLGFLTALVAIWAVPAYLRNGGHYLPRGNIPARPRCNQGWTREVGILVRMVWDYTHVPLFAFPASRNTRLAATRLLSPACRGY